MKAFERLNEGIWAFKGSQILSVLTKAFERFNEVIFWAF